VAAHAAAVAAFAGVAMPMPIALRPQHEALLAAHRAALGAAFAVAWERGAATLPEAFADPVAAAHP
ncbi:MAG: hypothetical protein QM692_05895, partial [Thermomicrobiales bacterium]